MLAFGLALLGASPGMAANECGTEVAGADTLVCNADGTPVTDVANQASGITYANSNGLTLNIDNAGINVTNGVFLRSSAVTPLDVAVNGLNFNTITSVLDDWYGLNAETRGTGAATATQASGTITVTGDRAVGVVAQDVVNGSNSAAITASQTGGSITTSGDDSYGVAAYNAGLGATTASKTLGSISTGGAGGTGISAYGVVAIIDNAANASTSSASMGGGTLTTTGDDGVGIYAYSLGLGDATATLSGGALTTSGEDSQGLIAQIDNAASSGTSSASMTGGSLSTSGNGSYAVFAYTTGTGAASATLTNGNISTSGTESFGLAAWADNAASTATVTATVSGGSIAATGIDADAIRITNSGTGGKVAVISGGTIASGTGNAAAIHLEGTGAGSIDIGAAATVNGAASGVAIRDDGAAAVAVTTAGIVQGDALLGLGNDVFNLTGGTLTGDIFGDGIVASASDGNDAFHWTAGAWSGGFFGGNGSDTAEVSAAGYDGTQTLDGGDDALTADGYVDTLLMHGTSVALNGATTRNWEVLNFDPSATVTLTDIETTTVNAACGGSTTLTGGSTAVDVLGCAGNDTLVVSGTAMATNVSAGAGNDTLAWLGGNVVAINGGDGSDSLDVSATGYDGTQILDGGDDASPADGFVDTLLMRGATVALNGATARNWEVINFDPNATATLTDVVTTTVNAACNGSTTLTGSSTAVDVLGCAGNDTIAMAGASAVTNNVDGGAGNDTLTINTTGSVGGAVLGGAGNDAISWLGGALTSINGGDGSDSLEVGAAAYNGTQVLDGGDDASTADGFSDSLLVHGATLTLSGATVRNWEILNFDAGATVVLDNMVTATVNAACGGSTTLTGSSTAVDVTGCAGNDTIAIAGAATLTNLNGGAGNDALSINTTGSAGNVIGGAGNDTIAWLAGSLASINGDDGSDTLEVSAAAYNGTQILDGGDDASTADGFVDSLLVHGATLTLSGSTVRNWEILNFDAGATVVLNNMVTGTVNAPCAGNTTLAGNSVAVNVLGCAGNDIIAVTGASGVTNSVNGGAGNDTLTIDTTGISGSILGGAGNDTITWTAGAVGAINGGSGSDAVTVFAAGYVGNTVLDGGDDTSPADGSSDQLLLSGITAASDGADIVNWESVTLSNASLRILDGQLAVGVAGVPGTGLALTNGSTLNLGPAMVFGGDLVVNAGSRVLMPGGGTGTYVFNGGLDSRGILSTQDGQAGDAVTVNGNYVGGGRFLADVDYELRTVDTLRINGTVSGAPTTVLVTDVGTTGGVTPPDTPAPIRMIDAAGAASDQFVLDADSSMQGIYAYRLIQFDDGNFYLTTSTVQGASVIEALGAGLMAMSELPTLQQRTGNRYWHAGNHQESDAGVWVSTSTSQRDLRPERSTTGSTYQQDGWVVDIGADMPWLNNDNGVLTGGIFGRFSEGRSRSASTLFGSGSADHHTRALGATLNWQARRGYYSDLQLQVSATSNDLSLAGTPEADTSVDAKGYAASIEVGYRGHRTWALTPQAQLQYSSTSYDAFTFNGISVDSGKAQSLQARAGIALDHQNRWRAGNGKTQGLHFYALLDAIQELDGDVSMDATGTLVQSEPQRRWGRATLGFTAAMNDDHLSVYGEGAYQKAFDDGAANNGFGGRVGLRLEW